MTSEIGILNKNGVVLAADSAVTISNGINSKVFNSARKLFTLSKEHSVGIMIYGNAYFMGVPWEVIIGEYKKTIGTKVLDNTVKYVDEFINFILQFQPVQSQDALRNYIYIQTLNYLYLIERSVQYQFEQNFSNDNRRTFDDIYWGLVDNIEKEIEKLENGKENAILKLELDCIKEILEENLSKEYSSEQNILRLATLIYKAILLDYSNESITGIVVAGYGDKEIFPSLRQIELSGIFSNTLIWNVINEQEITQNNICQIIPFAQSEMIETIINGIDPRFNHFIAEQLDSIFKNNDNILISKDDLFNNIAEFQQRNNINPIFDLIGMQPIDEMAITAKTFIELTSFKRRIINTVESVGGPVDVLAISKGEGPVWINRK